MRFFWYQAKIIFKLIRSRDESEFISTQLVRIKTNLGSFANDSGRCIRNFFILWRNPNALPAIKWSVSQCQKLCLPENRFKIASPNPVSQTVWLKQYESFVYPNLKKSAAFPHASLSQRAIFFILAVQLSFRLAIYIFYHSPGSYPSGTYRFQKKGSSLEIEVW